MDVTKIKQWLELFTVKVNAEKAYLSDLDGAIGDGDHGMNMARGTTAMQEALLEKNPETAADIFKVAGMTLVSKVGGASGPLYGSAFISMAKAATSSEDMAEILAAGLEGIQKRGKAEVGEKTMVDTWAPSIEALKNDELTADKITEIVNATKDIKATKGRASYLGDRSIGHLDPGAVSSGYLFATLLEAEVV
ncbi:dihydroxyacetone kinase subunit DhaL [Vagococcus intermedius]|uniref:phosphoenolpyruvate--glycerone phosphotransferase n=1 Tax=Vagococcus intermedius TaxID=2991418 RepID=A0AAF0CWY1_9ENTE|nr:dihydroxyacetone kinase subunit DhaL [Vagococcus intermedius]WEG74346.1 dihydroxyacetone kinase subunit DhaL [Vagococcus intermedius]WEG76431.1 dihydroxyacetone kinase subunit DhaL [Vagococcus intermedius]